MSEPISIAKRLHVPRILWGALLASQVVYVGVLSAGLVQPERPPDPIMLPVLIGTATVVAIASFLLPEIIRRGAIAKSGIVVHDIPDPEAPIGFRGAAPTIRGYADPARVIARAFPLGFTPLILSLALAEAISIFGLTLGVTGHGPEAWAGFFAVGMTLTAIRFPTADTFLRPIEKHTGVRLPR